MHNDEAGGYRAPAPGRRPRPPVSVTFVIALCLTIAVIATVVALALRAPDGPLAGRALFVDPDSSAARAAAAGSTDAERHAAAVIAEQPAAGWLTPEEHPIDSVTAVVERIVADAASADAVPVFVVYGITDRDCGGESAGGLPADSYLDWVAALADGLGEHTSIVVLEPDSLALAPECGDPAARARQVAAASASLERTPAVVYLDGGHSDWRPVEEMAELLEDAGVDRVRGFATNVSNTQDTEDERDYARRLSAALGGAHAIIDTSRNGAGPAADGAWCNPPGRALGANPGDADDPVVDALLWIKPPGESDGTCNGGPPAGQWWAEQAIELVGNAGR